jgi:hypothetical protein
MAYPGAYLKAPKFGKVGKHWNQYGDIARVVLAEFLGTAIFIFVGVGSSISTGEEEPKRFFDRSWQGVKLEAFEPQLIACPL